METNAAIIILAAGKSSRLGQPKQLLPFKGNSLLGHVIHTAKHLSDEVIVVTGANQFSVESEIKNSGVSVVFNHEWEEGMASSIRCGLAFAQNKTPDLQSALFMVCDQPFVSKELLQNLFDKRKSSGKSIIASTYADIAGTPVLFDARIFPELMKLQGDIGARKIIVKYSDQVETVDFPLGKVDMDTAEDYKKLLLQKDLI